MSTLRKRRAAPAAQWPLDGAITVVLFAGLGGACAGLEEAGCPVQVANNHDPIALAAHAALHPHTRHVKGDIFDVDPIEATRGRPVKVLWASPDCRDHSVAKGGAPRSARVRSLPWQVCRWAGKTRPEVIFMENVREIRGWGPLVAKRDKATGRVLRLDGTVAARGERVPRHLQQLVREKATLGRSFRAFVRHIRALGYAYEDRDLCCADFGVPTSRRRWWAVARRDGGPIGWPERTHAPANDHQALGLQRWVGAHTIIDWSIPLPSIFDRKRPLVEATNWRLATGLQRFVLNNPRPFFIPLTHTGGIRVHDSAVPLPTLTTAHRGEFAVVAPHLTVFNENCVGVDIADPISTIMAGAPRFGLAAAYMIQAGYGEAPGQTPRTLDIEKPIGTIVAGGGKHALVAAWMAQHNLGVIGHPVTEPLSTMTTAGTQQQVAAGFLAHLRGTSPSRDATEPVPTLTAGGGHVAAVAAFMTKYYSTGGVSQGVDDPLHTASTKARFSVVGVQIDGLPYVIADIGMRMLEPHEAAAAHELTLPRAITVDGRTRALTKTESMRLIGNSVPKRMARLLAQANIVHALNRGSVAA